MKLFVLLCSLFVPVRLFLIKCPQRTYNILEASHFCEDLYSPPRIIPYVPYSIAYDVLVKEYTRALNDNDDISIGQCEEFRRFIVRSHDMPKPLIGIIGNDYMVGFRVLKEFNRTQIYLQTILPLQGNGQYNVTSMLKLFYVQYTECIINTNTLSTYWKNVLKLNSLYLL